MIKVTSEEMGEYYDDFWARTEKEWFKLETLQVYQDDVDSEAYQLFVQGRMDDLRKMLYDAVHDEQEVLGARDYESVKQTRLHIVELPLSEYLRFEIESYFFSEKTGEKVFLMPSSEQCLMKLPEPLQDFILFDDKHVIVNAFDKNNRYSHSLISSDPKEVSKFAQLKKLLMSCNPQPLAQFLLSTDYKR